MRQPVVASLIGTLTDYIVSSLEAVLYGWVDASENVIVDHDDNPIVFAGE